MKQENPYKKPIKKFLFLLGLLIISPLVLSIGFKMQRIYTENTGIYLSWGLIILGIILILYTVYFGFKTFQALLNALFRK